MATNSAVNGDEYLKKKENGRKYTHTTNEPETARSNHFKEAKQPQRWQQTDREHQQNLNEKKRTIKGKDYPTIELKRRKTMKNREKKNGQRTLQSCWNVYIVVYNKDITLASPFVLFRFLLFSR